MAAIRWSSLLLRKKIDKMNLKRTNFWITKTILPNMEITYIYEIVLVDRPLSLSRTRSWLKWYEYSIYWKSSRKKKSCLIRLTINTCLFFKKIIISLFSLEKSCSSPSHFSKQQNWIWNDLQHYSNLGHWTNWLAPTMCTLVNVKTDLDEFLSQNFFSTTWTWNSKCSGRMKINKFDWHKDW